MALKNSNKYIEYFVQCICYIIRDIYMIITEEQLDLATGVTTLLTNGPSVRARLAGDDEALKTMYRLIKEMPIPDTIVNTKYKTYFYNGELHVHEVPGDDYVWDWDSLSWVHKYSTQEMWDVVKRRRNGLLYQSDWTQLPDVPISTKQIWAEYRQQLRDITDQLNPYNILWPTPPGA